MGTRFEVLEVVFLFCGLIGTVGGVSCTNTDFFGVNSPTSENNQIDTTAGRISFLFDGSAQADFSVDCCGRIVSYEIFSDAVGQSVTFQTWKYTTGTSYELIAQNTFTTTKTGTDTFTIPAGQEISVDAGAGYLFGYTATTNPIKNKPAGSNVNVFALTTSTTTLNTVVDWGTSVDTYSPALRLNADAGNSPVISTPANGAVINLNSADPVATAVTTVAYSDADTGDTLTLEMSTNSLFSLTGVNVATAASLAGVTRTESLTFTVNDTCGNQAVSTVSVQITNDPPVIHNLPRSVVIREDVTAAQLLHTINATDTVDNVVCSITTTEPFEVKLVDATNYGIYSLASPGFNYLTKNSFSLQIDCNDVEHTVSKTFIIFLIKNSAPVMTNLPNVVTVPTSTASGTTLFTVAATDPESDTITYSMSCENPACPLTMVSTNGQIQLNADITTLTTTGFDVNVTVSDDSSTTGPKVLTLLISGINDPIVITNLPLTSSYPVFENTAVGTTVFTVSSSDQDVAQTKTYSMTSTNGAENYFNVDSTSGAVSISNTLNYETLFAAGTTSFDLTISVTDGVVTDTETLTLDITDINEPPSFAMNSYSLSTNEAVGGTVIGTPAYGVTNVDSGDSVTYDLNCGADSKFVSLNINTGEVSFQSNYDLDAGLSSSLTCTVTATDSGGLSDTANLYISIVNANDHTPAFAPTSYTFTVSYYAGTGTNIGSVTATDGDSVGTLTFSLDQTSLSDQFFQIDSSTGAISVAKSLAGLGYATTSTVTAHVFDNGGLTDTASVTIIVADTTTAATVTPSVRYREFIEDWRNIPWLIGSILTSIIICGFLVWELYTCRGRYSFSALRKACQRRPLRVQKKTKPTARKEYRVPAPPAQLVTVRKAPPPKEMQEWRSPTNSTQGYEGSPRFQESRLTFKH